MGIVRTDIHEVTDFKKSNSGVRIAVSDQQPADLDVDLDDLLEMATTRVSKIPHLRNENMNY